jgi:serine protease Do
LVAASLAVVAVLSASRPGQANGFLAATATPAATPTATPAPAAKAESAFITINPEHGFPLDPFLISLQGGGPVAASTLAPECTGYIPAHPTVIVDFKGTVDLLRTFFYSDGDTTLVIQTPAGAYLCGDDMNRLILDPTVEIAEPAAGRYAVWVGSKVATDLIPGFLAFTTRTDMDASRLVLGNLVKRAAAPPFIPVRDRLLNAAGRVEQALAAVKNVAALKAGGEPVTQVFTATGELPAVELQTGDTLCGGLVNIVPTYAFDWSGDAKRLTLFVEANSDRTLLVRTPDGSFLCADDTNGPRNLNPWLTMPEPAAGRYLVWIGRVDPGVPASGRLTLTEAADAMPAALEKQ